MGPDRTPQGRAVGRGRAPNPGRPTPRQGAPPSPRGALVPPPQRAKPARKSARCGVGDRSPCPYAPHPQPVGSGPRPHAARTGGRASESAPTLASPNQARSGSPPAPSCPANSAQSQLARAGAVGLVTGPHARPSRWHSEWVLGPGRTPQGWAVGRGRAPNPGRPSPRQEAPPPRRPLAPPQRAKPARKSSRCGIADRSPPPHPRHPQPVGSGRRPQAPRTGGQVWKSAHPQTPHTQARSAPPPGRPRAAPTERKASSEGHTRPQGGEQPRGRQGNEGTEPTFSGAK